MLNIIKKLLETILNNIDSGNSNITEEEGKLLINYLNSITDNKLSKYQACQLLNISRASFDNLVREGKLPQGIKQAGFKEKFWLKTEILKYITKDK